MGMTIEEHIVQLKKLKSFHNGSYGTSINFAIDTMQKYQKIQKIVEHWVYCGNPSDSIIAISEVVEDGKID